MRLVLGLVSMLVLTLAACGGQTDHGRATDPGSSPSDPAVPSEIPAAPGTVHTRGLVTVMDTASPELCLGPVAESYPPQCSGPAIEGWNWEEQHGVFDQEGKARWGQFAVTGTWDGSTFTVEGAIPAALYDAMALEEPKVPPAARSYTQQELDGLAETLGRGLAGAQGAFADKGHVLVNVTYDDGSLQAWADDEYGKHVVVVVPSLVDGP